MGKLIVLTGLDGSGTSTVAEQLHMEDKGSTKLKSPPFPFSSNRNEIDEKIYETSPAAHYLFYLASNVHLSKMIENTLNEKEGNIYCVRYFIDTVVHHRAKGLNVSYEHETELFSIRKPDYIFYLDVNEEERQKRLDQRGRGFLDHQLDDQELRNRFCEEFNSLESEFIRIQTTNRNIDEIVKEIQGYIK